PSSPAPAPTGHAASAAPPGGGASPRPEAPATLGEAVAGIVLPSDLVPRVPALSAPTGDERVLLGAETGVAVELAGHLADALVDLGYEPGDGDEMSRCLHRRGTHLRVTVVEPADPLRARAPGRVTLELSLEPTPSL
ncbi:MAG: hypothetical protein D6683_10820, partial [Actinomyces sp.]